MTPNARPYELFEPSTDPALKDLTALAAHICESPLAFISLQDRAGEWFRSTVGEWPVEGLLHVTFFHQLCEQQSDLWLVSDASLDSRFANAHIRFYAGVPLVTPEGDRLGTLCILDVQPRDLTPHQQDALRILSKQVMAQLSMRRQTRQRMESEERLRIVTDNARVGLVIVDPQHCYVYVNAAYAEILGQPPAGLVGRRVADVLGSLYRRQVGPRLDRAFRGERITFEVPRPGSPGQGYCRVRYEPAFAGGAVSVVVVVITDVGELRAAERALQAKNLQLETALATARMGVWWHDFGTDEVSTIQGSGPVSGLPSGLRPLAGADFFALVHPEDRPMVSRQVEEARSGTEPYRAEFRIVVPGGEVRWVAARGQCLRDGQGAAIALMGVDADITEHKQVEEALRARELLLSESQRIGRVGAWEWDIANDKVIWSDELYRIFGLEPGLFAGSFQAYLSLVHPEDRDRSRAIVQRALQDGQPFDFEERILQPNGLTRILHCRGQSQSDSAGTPVRMLGVCQDITERKQAEVRIEHLNRVYAVLSEINHVIVREQNPATIMEAACRIAVEKGRFSLAWIGLLEGPGDRFRITGHAGGSAETRRMLLRSECDCAFTSQAVHSGQAGVCNDIANHPRAGAWREAALGLGYQSLACLPLKSHGTVIGVLNLFASEAEFFDAQELALLNELATDVSFALELCDRDQERMRVEQALRESEERFRQLAENIHEVFWMTDATKQNMMYISPAYEKIWGRSCQSLYSDPTSWLDSIHPEDRACVWQAVISKQAIGEYDETYRIVRPDGVVRWIHDRAFPIQGPSGRVVRIVGTAEDISERRQLQDQLLQAQKMEAIGQLAGGVAHDFNNILTAIMMQTDLALELTHPPPETSEYLHDIKSSAEKAAALTRQLLAFGRRQILQPRQLDLNEVVTRLTKMLQRILSADVQLQVSLCPGQLLTRADPGMLDQILLNLVVNAHDAMPDGGVLSIESGTSLPGHVPAGAAAPGGSVWMRVTDTGSGMSPEVLTHIFEPFYSTKEPGQGTGLGLATVFGIVKQHGGTVEVHSELGKGTHFQVFLPALPGSSGLPGPLQADPAPGLGTESILQVSHFWPASSLFTELPRFR
ncbi:PAS domain-containing protein [bacterium]|nr:PAS domain-containing protein [bacterium]